MGRPTIGQASDLLASLNCGFALLLVIMGTTKAEFSDPFSAQTSLSYAMSRGFVRIYDFVGFAPSQNPFYPALWEKRALLEAVWTVVVIAGAVASWILLGYLRGRVRPSFYSAAIMIGTVFSLPLSFLLVASRPHTGYFEFTYDRAFLTIFLLSFVLAIALLAIRKWLSFYSLAFLITVHFSWWIFVAWFGVSKTAPTPWSYPLGNASSRTHICLCSFGR